VHRAESRGRPPGNRQCPDRARGHFIDLGAKLDFSTLGAEVWPAVVLSLFVLIGDPLIVMAIMGYRKRTGFLAGLTVAQVSGYAPPGWAALGDQHAAGPGVQPRAHARIAPAGLHRGDRGGRARRGTGAELWRLGVPVILYPFRDAVDFATDNIIAMMRRQDAGEIATTGHRVSQRVTGSKVAPAGRSPG
jgi:hypothetical protein